MCEGVFFVVMHVRVSCVWERGMLVCVCVCVLCGSYLCEGGDSGVVGVVGGVNVCAS